jgi:phosphoglycerate transport regulatory protein PgtC
MIREAMAGWVRRRALAGLLALACGMAGALSASLSAQPVRREILVMTSFPSTFYEPFRRAFEQRVPGYRLRVLNRKTTAAIQQVTQGQYAHVDIFWASSPDAFEVLKAGGRLVPLTARVATPERMIGGFPLDDPSGRYRGFAVSGTGMIWNEAMLARASLPAPGAIADLANPHFRGMIAMSAPSRSGTTHLMVETILQRYGWVEGWKLWLRIAGNLATITARSFSVASGVAQGRFAVGLSIDFLGRGANGSVKLGFAYPAETVFLPASIAILTGGLEPEGARRFVSFVLSAEGQALLADPRIQRQPLARLQNPAGDPAGKIDLFDRALENGPGAPFDAALSGQRYELVNLVFDELITERLVRLQRFWRRADELRRAAATTPALIAEIERAEREALDLPLELTRFGETLPAETILRVPRGVPPPEHQAALVERLRRDLEMRLGAGEIRLEAVGERFEAVRQLPNSVWP